MSSPLHEVFDMLDASTEVKNFRKVCSYTVLTLLIANSVKVLSRYNSVPHEEVVRKAFAALKERASSEKPPID